LWFFSWVAKDNNKPGSSSSSYVYFLKIAQDDNKPFGSSLSSATSHAQELM